MEITLNHTIVPARDNIASATFYQHVFGFEFIKEWGHFAVVRVNSSLVLDFQTKESFYPQHYAFKVSEQQFDSILERIQRAGITIGSNPAVKDGQINHLYGGRGVYFKDPDGHILEILTQDYDLDTPV